jgi:hypothetical protein
MAWLTFENDNGANIYVSANPLRPGSRKRTKECIASVRHIYIDIDDDGDARLAALRASDLFLPRPQFSRLRRANIRRSGVLLASTSRIRNRRSNCSPKPSAAIPLAPTATGCCASPVSTTGSILPRIVSRSNTLRMRLYGPEDFRLDNVVGSSVLPLRGNARKHRPFTGR